MKMILMTIMMAGMLGSAYATSCNCDGSEEQIDACRHVGIYC